MFICTEYNQTHLYHMILLAKYLFKVATKTPVPLDILSSAHILTSGWFHLGFVHQVSVHFVPPSAVPGDTTNFQVTALPYSLCGVSAVDQSVLIKEPGKTLNAEKVTVFLTTTRSGGMLDVEGSIPNAQPLLFSFEQLAKCTVERSYIYIFFQIYDLLPVRKATFVPYEVQDPIECMEVRSKRSILPFPESGKNDAHTVFQVICIRTCKSYSVKSFLLFFL